MTPGEALENLAQLVNATDEGSVTVPPKVHRVLLQAIATLNGVVNPPPEAAE